MKPTDIILNLRKGNIQFSMTGTHLDNVEYLTVKVELANFKRTKNVFTGLQYFEEGLDSRRKDTSPITREDALNFALKMGVKRKLGNDEIRMIIDKFYVLKDYDPGVKEYLDRMIKPKE